MTKDDVSHLNSLIDLRVQCELQVQGAAVSLKCAKQQLESFLFRLSFMPSPVDIRLNQQKET